MTVSSCKSGSDAAEAAIAAAILDDDNNNNNDDAAAAAAAGAVAPPMTPSPTTPAPHKHNHSNNNKKNPNSATKIPVRPGNVRAELEALRQRGLATLLNKHFTDEIRKLACEKAAADEALRDLERRKAQTSDFTPSAGDGVVSPMDALFLSVNNWRRECRRKEKETLLLYQRYVDRFGSSGVPIQVPGGAPPALSGPVPSPQAVLVPSSSAAESPATATTTQSSTSHMSSPSAWAAAPPPSDTPPTTTTAAATGRRSGGNNNKRKGSNAAVGGPSPTKVQVHSMAAAIEQTLDEYIKQGALQDPSIRVLGKDTTFSKQIEKQEADFKNHYRRRLEAMGVDAKANDMFLQKKNPYGPNDAYPLLPRHHHNDNNGGLHDDGGGAVPALWDNGNSPLLGIAPSPLASPGHSDRDDDDDDEEYDDDEGQDGLGPLFIHHSAGDDDSVMSGLTFNSALTREILDDCERTVVTFLQEEREAIRKIMDDNGGDDYYATGSATGGGSGADYRSGTYHNNNDAHTARSKASQMSSSAAAAAAAATAQAETMVQQMQDILNNFRETNPDAATIGTGPNGNGTDGGSGTVGTVVKEARKFPTSNPHEQWMVYYDEYYQREYYHELNTNKTQWEAPVDSPEHSQHGDEVSTSHHSSTSRSTPLLQVPTITDRDVVPDAVDYAAANSSTRIERYRRQRRRQQRRRRRVAVAVLVAAVGVAVSWAIRSRTHDGHPTTVTIPPVLVLPFVLLRDRVLPASMHRWIPLPVSTHKDLPASEAEEAAAKRQAEAERQMQVEEERERLQREEAAKREREQALLQQEKDEEEARRRQQQQARDKEAAERAAREAHEALVSSAREEARKAQDLLDRLQRREAEAREALHFRAGGRIPLAYYVEDLGLMVRVGSRPYV